MFKWFPAAAVLAIGLFVLGGCTSGANPGGVTVLGSLSGDYIDFIGNPVITVFQGGESLPVEVTTVAAGSNVYGSYSIPNVPMGDYSIKVEFTSSMYTFYSIPTYSIDGGTPVNIGTLPPVGGGSGPSYLYLITISGITISKESTIDIYLGNNG
jgi:hypothetical protein